MKHWIEGGRRVLRIPGTFDGEAVRDVDEVGVAALARLVERSKNYRIALRGLSAHQRRILRHLGAWLSDVGAEIAS